MLFFAYITDSWNNCIEKREAGLSRLEKVRLVHLSKGPDVQPGGIPCPLLRSTFQTCSSSGIALEGQGGPQERGTCKYHPSVLRCCLQSPGAAVPSRTQMGLSGWPRWWRGEARASSKDLEGRCQALTCHVRLLLPLLWEWHEQTDGRCREKAGDVLTIYSSLSYTSH